LGRRKDGGRKFFWIENFAAREDFLLCNLSIGASELADQFRHDAAVDIRQPIFSPLKGERQPFMVQSKQMQDRGLKVMDVDRPFGGVKAQIIGGA